MIGLQRFAAQPEGAPKRNQPEGFLDLYPSTGSRAGNIITIPAKTAIPIVSSVPKCRKPKAARAHPMDTIHGSTILDQTEPLNYARQTANQLHRQHQLGGRGKLAENQQVLLIVQEDHMKGGGVPILGRRLASKSVCMDEYDEQQLAGKLPLLLLQPEPEAPYYPESSLLERQHQQVPVVGRRTHRMLQQHREEAKLYRHYRGATSGPGWSKQAGEMLVQPAELGVLELEQVRPQVYVLDERRLPKQPQRKAASKGAKLSHSAQSVPNIACQQRPLLSAFAGQPHELQGRYLASGRLEAPSKQAYSIYRDPASSTSCSSLCSPSASLDCLECCQRRYVGQSASDILRAATDRRSRCCSSDSQQAPSLLSCASGSPPSASSASGRQGAHSRRLEARHASGGCHQTCQANGFQPGSSQRRQPRSEHVNRSESEGRSRPSRVASNRKESPPSSEEAKAVSQMYESLAAELKAKLGNPNIKPILLPPKDYDTMSRKQGKLNGIELRRSTNPQLVGPTANKPAEAARKSSAAETQSSPSSSCNSSSEINSTSCSQSSPTSSSSEHTARRQLSSRAQAINMLERKSPDECASSDSGHSGSGRLDSRLSSNHGEDNITAQSQKVREESFGPSEMVHSKKYQPNRKREENSSLRGQGIHLHNPSKVSDGVLWNGRVEVPLKVNSHKNDGNTYLATKQIIY